MKLVSWNVNGIRSVLGKGFREYLATENPDVLCLQEVKARPEQVPDTFEGYEIHWNPAQRAGYSGTAVLTRISPLSVSRGLGIEEHDAEGRVITLEFEDFFLLNVYTPNSKRDLARLDYRTRRWTPAFADFLDRLQHTKPVVFCGDMNVAHREIDLARPKDNLHNAGFTIEEREAFDHVLSRGFVDTYRHLQPEGRRYTWWSYQNGARERNIGWRIDYLCVSRTFLPRITESFIHDHVMGSDHCPVGVILKKT